MATRIERMIAKIERIETLCAEVKAELEILKKENDAKSKKPVKKEVTLPSEAECRDEFNMLYEAFLAGKPEAVEEFVQSKTKDYLKIFCKVNDLSADVARMSKKHIIDEILRWLAQRKAITQDAF